MSWLSRVALSRAVNGSSPRRGIRWHLIIEAPVFLRLLDRLRSRAIRSANHPISSPVVTHLDRVEPSSAATRRRTVGSAATTCLVLRSGKPPMRCQARLLSKYQDPRARFFAKRKCNAGWLASRRSRTCSFLALRSISASDSLTVRVLTKAVMLGHR
ncbi:hypothetical protein D3C71_1554900 [compost metagenome]